MKKRIIFFIVLALCVGFDGWTKPLDEKQAKSKPRIRVASPPFPFPLFRYLEDADVGGHHYRARFRRGNGARREISRGHCYTEKAGFIDLSHLRKTIDWTAYLQSQIHRALTDKKPELKIKCAEPSIYYLSFNYPPDWDEWSASKRGEIIKELSLQVAQETAFIALTWHEILTWHGFKATWIITEKMSAFSYEDMPSHALGIQIAGTAIRDEERAFNEAAERAIQDQLKTLGMVSKKEAKEAIEKVKGIWWKRAKCLKRLLDIGLADNAVTPWLVKDLSFTTLEKAKPLVLPKLGKIDDLDFSGFYQLEIDPKVKAAKKFMPRLPDGTTRIRPDVHFPIIMKDIRKLVMNELGPESTKPYPTTSSD